MNLIIEADGRVRGAYREVIDLAALGATKITRASQVEPDAEGHWCADLAPVGGPLLGPFYRRRAGLAPLDPAGLLHQIREGRAALAVPQLGRAEPGSGRESPAEFPATNPRDLGARGKSGRLIAKHPRHCGPGELGRTRLEGGLLGDPAPAPVRSRLDGRALHGAVGAGLSRPIPRRAAADRACSRPAVASRDGTIARPWPRDGSGAERGPIVVGGVCGGSDAGGRPPQPAPPRASDPGSR